MKNRRGLHEKARLNKYLALEIGGILFLLGLWFLLAYLVQTINPERGVIMLPSPIDVIRDFPTFATFKLSAMGQPDIGIAAQVVAENTLVSLGRLLSGMGIGILLGVVVVMLLGTYTKVNKLVGSVIMFLRTIPILALVPLFLCWFAGREEGNILYIAFAVFCMIVVNTVEAIKNVPLVYYQYAATLGATKSQMLRTITLPHIIPELVGGISVVVGMAWAIVLAAEYLAAQKGIGFMLIASERYLYTSKMVFLLLLLMVLAIVINNTVLKVGNDATRWKPRVNEKRM